MANAVEASRDGTLQDLVSALGGRGDGEAIVAFRRTGAQRLSFTEFGHTVDRLAWGLAARGLGRGDRILICATNRPEWIFAALATIRAGATVVPVDAQMGEQALRHVFADSETRLIFATASEAERLAAVPPPEGVEMVLLADRGEDRAVWSSLLRDEPHPLAAACEDDVAALFYTSGTTGIPKGVPLTHRNIRFEIDTLVRSGIVHAGDRVLLPLPFHHVYPFVVGMLTGLAAGLPLILPRALTGPQIVEAIREGRVSLIIGVPRLYTAMFTGISGRVSARGSLAAKSFRTLLWLSTTLRRSFKVNIGRRLFAKLHETVGPELRLLVSGGAALKTELAWQLQGLGWSVATGYGLTETAPMLTINMPETGRLESAGRVIDGVEVRIDRDAVAERGGDTDAAADGGGEGSFGEIVVRGPNVFAGYLNMPEETEKAFTGDGWFRTGDLGALDDAGFLSLSGRLSTMIVTEGGKNVHPEDVEDAYLASPLIREIAVLERNGKLVALIVPETKALPAAGGAHEQTAGGAGAGDQREAIAGALREISRKLPTYQRIGDFVLTGETLPRTRLGKPRRHLLPERFDRAQRGETQAVGQKGPIAIDDMAAEDRTLLEDDAARSAWAYLAEKYAEEPLTPDSNLQLDLGVDSMEWLNLTLEIAQRTGVELDEGAIGRIESIRDLLVEVGQAGAAAPGGVAPLLDDPEAALAEADRKWIAPLSAGQARMTRALFVVNRFLITRLFRLETRGREHLPQEGPYLMAPTHASLLDPFAIGAALDYERLRRTYWAGWTGIVFNTPLRRWFSRTCQVVPIDPDRAVVSSLALGGAVLKRGDNLIWFPEGERSPSGKLQAFRAGVGLLLSHIPVPVVPVVIEGAYDAWPRDRKFPRLRPIRVTFYPPVDPATFREQGDGATPQARIASALHDHFTGLVAKASPPAVEDRTGAGG
ncbi:MAG: AMP-binding protein [Rhodospirillales bacterium]|nr:AMP-binding protein [Rhodospirillales bacterium]